MINKNCVHTKIIKTIIIKNFIKIGICNNF